MKLRNHLSRFGVVRSSPRCKLQTISSIFSTVLVFLVRRYLNLSLPFCFLGDTLFAWSTKVRLASVVNAADLVTKLGRALIYFVLIVKSLGIWLIPAPKKFTVEFSVLLVTWLLIVCTHGIAVFQFYDLTPLVRLCNNLPSCLQFLLNLFSHQLSPLMRYLMNSFCSFVISQGNIPNRLLSVVNLFSILRTSSLYYLLSSSRYPHSFLSNFPNLLVWTLKLCLYNSVRNLLIIHCTVPRIILYSPSMLPTHILCNLLRKACIPHNLHNSLQVFMCSPSSAQTGIPCASDSSTPPSSGSILATFKFFDLQLGTDASIGSAELSISNYGYPMLFSYWTFADHSFTAFAALKHSRASQHYQSSRRSVKES